MFLFEKPVSFEDVDAAHIVFFPRVLAYCHDAMAALMGQLEGGYAALVVDRRVGLPTVHLDVDFSAPIGFGDKVAVEVRVARLGRSSCTFDMRLQRARDGVAVARVKLVCVSTDLVKMRSRPFPEDVLRVLEAHVAPDVAPGGA